MCSTIGGFRFKHFALVCFLTITFSGAVYAQDSPNDDSDAEPSPTPQASPSTSLEHRFLKHILQDQRVIWTSPFSLHHSDVNWIAPLSVSSAILFATDRRSAGEMTEPGNHRTRLRISADISQGGSLFPVSAIAGTFYLVGRTTHNSRARETGLLSMEALIDSGLVTSALKIASQRPRPNVDDASGEFYDKGSSFPSGHAASAWSVATVIASEYGQHRPLVLVATYGVASAVSMARYTGQNHFLSDVLVGSAIGYGIGRYVYRAHHDSLVDQSNGPTRHGKLKSKLIPFTFPIYNAAQRSYGLAMSWPL
jgi:membrane-associated phospholipid phosphatase